jgi:hypothetical protein
MTSIVRRDFNENGVLIDTHKEYPLVVRMVANDLKVPFVDMQLLTEQLEISYGPENSKVTSALQRRRKSVLSERKR